MSPFKWPVRQVMAQLLMDRIRPSATRCPGDVRPAKESVGRTLLAGSNRTHTLDACGIAYETGHYGFL